MSQQVFERLELKYCLDERRAAQIRDAISPWVVPDKYNGAGRSGGYPISSLYLDTPGLAFHRAKLRGERDRFKLRIRTYGAGGDAHLEIKRKVGAVVHKQRVSVPRADLFETLNGLPPEDPGRDRLSRAILARFQALFLRTGAEPKLTVFYEREAYTSTTDAYARVTFDRRICAAAADPMDWTLHSRSEPTASWQPLDRFEVMPDAVTSVVVLELKCETFVPLWMSSLIREFGLKKTGFSKYSAGIARCGLGLSQPQMVWRS